MLVIGLTGGVATGKSTVTERLKALGAAVIDADRIAREVVEPGEPALERIVDEFGPGVLKGDGSLDRARLGAIVFGDAAKRRRLEAILHPEIRRRMEERLRALREEGAVRVAVCDIPLLFESKGSRQLVDKVAVVYATREQQLARLMARNGFSEAEASARIDAQIPIDEKVKWADYVIDNTGPPGAATEQVDRLWEEWVALADRLDRARQEER